MWIWRSIIARCPKPQKDNGKQRKQERFNEKGDRACNNSENKSEQKLYGSMACMSGNEKCPSENYGDSSQLTNSILDSEATCHMTPEVSDFITGSLKDTDKYIEVTNGHHFT